MSKCIYQVVCLTTDEYGTYTQEFVIGTYINEFTARNVMEEVQEQALEDGQDLEYMIHKYPIIDWEAELQKKGGVNA